jgi:hypothetical protein
VKKYEGVFYPKKYEGILDKIIVGFLVDMPAK